MHFILAPPTFIVRLPPYTGAMAEVSNFSIECQVRILKEHSRKLEGELRTKRTLSLLGAFIFARKKKERLTLNANFWAAWPSFWAAYLS